MPSDTDLSALSIEAATDELLRRVFRVRPGTPKSWEEGSPPPDEERRLADGSWIRRWGEGPTVLLAHGFEGRASQWTPLADRLRERRMSVASLDMPGHGKAEGLPPNPFAFSRAITHGAAVLGPCRAIIGHSQGAIAALHAVAHGLRSDRLVMIAPVVLIEAYLRSVCRSARLSDEGTESFLEKVEAVVGAAPSAFSGPDLASHVAVPSLVVHDQQDRQASFDGSEALVASWEAATLHSTRRLGHRRILYDAEVVARVTHFVS